MKTYSLNCKDVGKDTGMNVECDYIAQAESKDEVIKMMTEHFENTHPQGLKDYMEKMSKNDLEQKMMDNIMENDDEIPGDDM